MNKGFVEKKKRKRDRKSLQSARNTGFGIFISYGVIVTNQDEKGFDLVQK